MAMYRILPAALLSLASVATLSAQTTFTPAYPTAFSEYPQYTLQADLNSDGIPDIISGYQGPTQALLSTGSGKFALHTYALNSYVPVGAGDFNGDGHNDVLFAYGSQLEIAYGDGKGNFPTIKTFPSLPVSANNELGILQGVATDVNGDGRPDILLGYRNSTTGNYAVRLYLNNGTSFTDKGDVYTYTVPAGATGVELDSTPPLQLTLGDFDADGHADLSFRVIYAPASNPVQTSNNLVVLYGSGTGTFTPKTVYSNRETDLTYAAADVNDDTFTDLTATDVDQSIHIFYGSASRTFKETIIPAKSITNPPYRGYSGYPPLIADFDGNGYKDIAYIAAPAVGNGQNQLGISSVYQTPSRTWQSSGFTAVDTFQSYEGDLPFYTAYLGDYNKDAKPDVSLITSGDANTHPDTADLVLNTGTHTVGACAAPIIGINVCSPGATSASPVKFSFSATSYYPLRKMEVWVDGVKKSETFHVFGNYGYSDVSLTLAAGKHNIAFFSGTFDGDTTKKTITVTVP